MLVTPAAATKPHPSPPPPGFLGALGSFVSGSVMGSNMTQGGIQAVAAARLGVPVTSMLAVQVAGACAGKMVCISSILVSCPPLRTPLHSLWYLKGCFEEAACTAW